MALEDSQLVTRVPGRGPGIFYVDPVLSEREFTEWLTLGTREIPKGDRDDSMHRVAAYDGALLDEFFETLPERILFWARTREREIAKNEARFAGSGERVGTSQIGCYVARLEWVAHLETDSGFLRLDGHQRFYIVAIALRYGVDSAIRCMHGRTASWGDDELQAAITAKRALEFLIYQQRGMAVEFGLAAGV